MMNENCQSRLIILSYFILIPEHIATYHSIILFYYEIHTVKVLFVKFQV